MFIDRLYAEYLTKHKGEQFMILCSVNSFATVFVTVTIINFVHGLPNLDKIITR